MSDTFRCRECDLDLPVAHMHPGGLCRPCHHYLINDDDLRVLVDVYRALEGGRDGPVDFDWKAEGF